MIFQPEWSPEGVLYFVSDRSGWWNLTDEQKSELLSRCAKCRLSLPCHSGGLACPVIVESRERNCLCLHRKRHFAARAFIPERPGLSHMGSGAGIPHDR